MRIEDFLVSGAPTQTYPTSGNLFEFHAEVMDRSRAPAAGISYLFDLYSNAYYRHTATIDMFVDDGHPWSTEMLSHYNNEKHCHSAASVVLQIENATIHQSAVYCHKDERNFALYESFRAPDRAMVCPSLEAIADAAPAGFQQAGQAYLYLGSVGSFNYGHWLVDDLPRAKAWIELRKRLGVSCIFVLSSFGQKIDEVRVDSLRKFIDPQVSVQFISPDLPCRIANLYYVTPVSYHPRIKNPAAIHFLRMQAEKLLPNSSEEPSRRIFVARRPPNSRSIVNFDELCDFLTARKFDIVEPENFAFTEQVALFQQAQIVIGQMGAAMTSTLFCRPGTNLIYLAPIGWAEPFYLDLAAVGGQQYNVLTGPATSEGPSYLSNFFIPVDRLYHRLKYMGIDVEG
jgi:hypothetical protein